MAVLNLTKIFVNLVSSGAAVSGQSARDRGEEYKTGGEVRTYAGGRQRAITTEGEAGTYTFMLLLVPRSTVETLRSWVGQTVQVRDNKSRRLIGVYHGLAIAEIISRPTWNVGIELRVVTAPDGV